MTDTTKPVEPKRIWAWPHYDFRGWYAGGCSTEPLMDGTNCTEYVLATALDAANAEIERLTKELKFWTDCAAVRFRRAEKAEADGAALVAAAYADAKDQVKSYADGIVDGWAKECIRMAADGIELPADATAALEARDAAKMREGLLEAAAVTRQNYQYEAARSIENHADTHYPLIAAIKEQQP